MISRVDPSSAGNGVRQHATGTKLSIRAPWHTHTGGNRCSRQLPTTFLCHGCSRHSETHLLGTFTHRAHADVSWHLRSIGDHIRQSPGLTRCSLRLRPTLGGRSCCLGTIRCAWHGSSCTHPPCCTSLLIDGSTVIDRGSNWHLWLHGKTYG